MTRVRDVSARVQAQQVQPDGFERTDGLTEFGVDAIAIRAQRLVRLAERGAASRVHGFLQFAVQLAQSLRIVLQAASDRGLGWTWYCLTKPPIASMPATPSSPLSCGLTSQSWMVRR